jgi:tetratricopeptide (TPR) repeat protein
MANRPPKIGVTIRIGIERLCLGVVCCAFFWAVEVTAVRAAASAYAAQEAELMARQSAAPDDALQLATTLMEQHPAQCRPYEIAANLYTLKKDYAAAESVLLKAIDRCSPPPALFVRLAHFYRRTMPDKLDPWISQMQKHPKVADDPALAAKLLTLGGHHHKAIRHLEAVTRTPGYTFGLCLALSRHYAQGNQDAKARQRLMEFTYSHRLDKVQAEKLLGAFLAPNLALDRRQTDFGLDLICQIAATRSDYVADRKWICDNLEKLLSRDADVHVAASLEDRLGREEFEDMGIWLSALYLQAAGKPEDAHLLLAEVKTADPRLMEEKARLSSYGKDLSQIRSSWQDLLASDPRNARLRIAFARVLTENGLNLESDQIIDALAAADLPAPMRWQYYALVFANAAAQNDYLAIVAAWNRAGRYYAHEDFDIFKNLIFSHLPETEQHRKLLSALESVYPRSWGKTAAIELLTVFIAEQLRDQRRYFHAADAFLSKQPSLGRQSIANFVDVAIEQALASLAAAQPSAMNSAPRGPRPDVVAFIAKWSRHLVEQQPDSLSYQSNAIIGAYLKNGLNAMKQRCKALLQGNESNHHHLYLIARTLFRIHRYEDAAEFYQRANTLRPDIVRHRLDHAACLEHLGRYEQSRAIYVHLIRRPTAIPWDLETLLERIWGCFQKQGREDGFEALIAELAAHGDVEPSALHLVAGALLVEKGRFSSGEALLKRCLEETADLEARYEAYLTLAGSLVSQKKYGAAIDLYSTCLGRYRGDRLKTIDCLFNRAEIRHRDGAHQAAIEDWSTIAATYPDDPVAAEALLRAAAVAEKNSADPQQARRLYEACLTLAQKGGATGAMARQKLASFSQAGAPKE